MTVGNGKGAGKCPHNCSTCRSIELGLSGRALTQSELILVHGGLREPSREGRLVYSDETREAELARDVAHVAHEDALRRCYEATARADNEQWKARRLPAGQAWGRQQEIQAAVAEARAELDEVGELLIQAGRRYRSLAQRDAEQHRLASAAESAATQRASRTSEKRQRRAGALARLWG